MYYVYILYSGVSDKYYVGHTDDVVRRLKEHNELSESSYTSKHRPWTLKAYFQISEDRGLAMRVERFIKKQKSRKFIEKILDNNDIGFILDRLGPVG